jgi:hypothetical protein
MASNESDTGTDDVADSTTENTANPDREGA